MSKQAKLTQYVSELDALLQSIENKKNFSDSQLKEISLNKQVAKMRDHSQISTEQINSLWNKF